MLTKSTKFLILRTLETPELSMEEAKQKAAHWKATLVNSTRLIPLPGYLGNNSRGQMQLVLDICHEHKLALYVAAGGETNVYKRIRF